MARLVARLSWRTVLFAVGLVVLSIVAILATVGSDGPSPSADQTRPVAGVINEYCEEPERSLLAPTTISLPPTLQPTQAPSHTPASTPSATTAPPVRPTSVAPVWEISLPDGYSVHVSAMGCLPDGDCPIGEKRANYYWAPTRTAVICADQTAWTLKHEACHAHQHLTILEELGIEPAPPYDLHEWDLTSEARSWNAAVTTAWPDAGQWARQPTPQSPLEDFAITCGLYLTDPQLLLQVAPVRYEAIDTVLRPVD